MCTRRPRVAVLATGTELRRPGQPLGPGEVYEANGLLLAAALAAAGGDVELAADRCRRRGCAPRGARTRSRCGRPRHVGRRLGRSARPRAPHRGELGVEEVFWRVAVKPGKPVAFGVRGRTLVFGLPGNPVSSLVCCELFVRPALLGLQGALRTGAGVLRGQARREGAAEREPRRVRPRARHRRRRRRGARAGAGPGVPHDRARRPAPTRSCSRRAETASSPRARPCATCCWPEP